MLTDTLPAGYAAAGFEHAPNPSPGSDRRIELSVVIPCLNEAETLGMCLRKAQRALSESGSIGEIIVADNGSTDGSSELATQLGARLVAVHEKGYGNALRGGIAAARGRYVIMGDADDSYDFAEIPRFLAALRQGHDLVMGCRLPQGGGRVLPGAMPALHRWIGNPLFSWLARRLFAVPVHDIYCGLRGFTKQCYDAWALESHGMEFAIEMIVKAGLRKQRFAEIPITLHPDGRISGRSHLRTFRDGWRTLRFLVRNAWHRPKLLAVLERPAVTQPFVAASEGGIGGYGLGPALVAVDGRQSLGHAFSLASMHTCDMEHDSWNVAQAAGACDEAIPAVGDNRPPSCLARWCGRFHSSLVHPRRVRVLSNHLAELLPRGARVLDIGCGDGLLARKIAEQRPDVRLSGVETARRSQCQIHCDEFDGRHLDVADRSFDVVLLIDVLHHTEDPLVLLREAARVARVGIVIKDHLLCGRGAGFTLRMMDRLGNRRYGVPLPFNYWTRTRWQQAFRGTGLQVERWEERLRLYPWPASLLFDRSLHFLAALQVLTQRVCQPPVVAKSCQSAMDVVQSDSVTSET